MKRFIKSFSYAGQGIAYAIRKERNFRIHLCFMTYMFGFLAVHDFFEVSRTQLAILIAMCAAVISLELVNTGIENAVNLASKELTAYGKIAKDAASGAVLVSAIASVAVGIAILYQPAAFAKMAEYYKANPAMLILLAVTVVISVLFAFIGPEGMKSSTKHNSEK